MKDYEREEFILTCIQLCADENLLIPVIIFINRRRAMELKGIPFLNLLDQSIFVAYDQFNHTWEPKRSPSCLDSRKVVDKDACVHRFEDKPALVIRQQLFQPNLFFLDGKVWNGAFPDFSMASESCVACSTDLESMVGIHYITGVQLDPV